MAFRTLKTLPGKPGKLGTLLLAPGLTTLARGLQVHARNRPSGLALAQALV
jgi:hypothetical protein